MEEYQAILRNPLCSIIKEDNIKLSDKTYNEDTGKLSSIHERIVKVVEWSEKVLAL